MNYLSLVVNNSLAWEGYAVIILSSCGHNPICQLINTLGVKINLKSSVQVRVFQLADPLPKLNSKMILEVCACLARGYMGVKTGRGVASAIDFLCKIEISKFVTCL